jgi:hypothetical protein
VYPREAAIEFRMALARLGFFFAKPHSHFVTSGKLLGDIYDETREATVSGNVNNACPTWTPTGLSSVVTKFVCTLHFENHLHVYDMFALPLGSDEIVDLS